MSWINKYKELLSNQGINFFEYQGILFHEYNQIIVPRGPLKVNKPSNVNSNHVLNNLKGKLVWWSYYQEDILDSDWYGIIKEKHTEISDYLSSNLRNQIRKGLKNFEIKRIEASYLQQNGLDVYEKVQLHYFPNSLIDKELFISKLEAYSNATDIIEIWGVFNDDVLVGYCEINLYDKLEANISEIKILPEYNKLYASYTLFHFISEEYLKIRKFQYISDGYRTLLHNTGIQDFLIKKFEFLKIPLKLECQIKFPFNLVLMLLFPLRKIAYWPSSLKSVFKLMEAAKNKKSGLNRI